MPVSDPQHLPALIHLVNGLRPARVLDVGVGMGSLGFLMRQSLDICYGRIAPESWSTTIDGVEVFEGYRNPVWNYAYSRVQMGDIRHVLSTLGGYDLVCCCDVLEHFEHAEAVQLIRALLEHSRVLIATSPNHDIPQGAWGGNEAERHLSVVTREDFPGLAVHHRGKTTDLYAASRHADAQQHLRDLGEVAPRAVAPDPLSLPFRIRRKVRKLLR